MKITNCIRFALSELYTQKKENGSDTRYVIHIPYTAF